MSQSESMAIPMEGRLSKSELLELKNKMNARALAKKRSRTALRLVANVVFAVLILLPLLYAISIPNAKAKTLFATHYHELNEMERAFKRIKNYNVSVKEDRKSVV